MQGSSVRIHVICFVAASAFCLALFLCNGNQDHLSAINLKGDRTWYMNFRNSKSMLIQDRDIFYHHIGQSIEYAKKADIIIIGHSMMLFGIDWRLLEAFAKRNHIRIYNMASASDISGEFSLRTIEKYHLHPKIWILNADDTGGSFFAVQLWDVSNNIVGYKRGHAYKNVISTNIKWKFEIILKKILPLGIFERFFPKEFVNTYRSVVHGNWYNDDWPKYTIQNNSFINVREPNCHAKPEEFNLAAKYIKRLKSGDVVLTLVPYAASCRTRVKEIAEYLHVPFISIGWRGMTSWDGNAHLDQAGARKFTLELIRQLEQTPSFKKLAQERRREINYAI